MHIKDLIDELKYKHRLHSDRKVAAFLNLSPSALHKIVHGGGMSDETALKIAVALDREPLEIIAIGNADTAKSDDVKSFWSELAKQMGTAASFILITTALLTPNTSFSKENQITLQNIGEISIYYVKCRIWI